MNFNTHLNKVKALPKRVKRKLKHIIHKLIPLNRFYKPLGIYESTQEYVHTKHKSKSVLIEIYPGFDSKIDIPMDFYEKCASYAKPKLSITLPPSFITKIKKGRLYTDKSTFYAIISEDNKLIGDISYQYKTNDVDAAANNGVFKQNFFPKPVKYDGTLFHALIGGSGSDNYFHWLIDVLPRIHLLQKSGWFDKTNHFLVPAYKHEYQKTTLKQLGISKDKIIDGEHNMHVTADNLIASSHVRRHAHVPPWVLQFLQETFLKNSPANKTGPSLVYISRSDSLRRFVINEEELLVLLKEYGFKTFQLSYLSFQEQVDLFAKADVILTPHGAALGNLVFCKAGTKVIELFASEYITPIYYDLSKKMQLPYQYLIGENHNDITNIKQGMHQNMHINLEKLRKMLDTALAHLMANKSA